MEIRLSREVERALGRGGPVVALESTLVAHGFPSPDNLAVGRALEGEVRAAGAVPATIAMLDGVACVGLGETELERLATDPQIAKASTRDLAALAARGSAGATTVAATAYLAARVGIRIFATGGIGGVHRGGADISADIGEIARSPVAVISTGAKAILDLPATFEALETAGIPVIGFGCDEFPAFYTAKSGLALDHRFDDVAVLARAIDFHLGLGLGGVVVCNPPPAASALDRGDIKRWISAALEKARASGVTGKAVTPYLLKAINEASRGRTLACNRALALSNASLGGRLAAALCA